MLDSILYTFDRIVYTLISGIYALLLFAIPVAVIVFFLVSLKKYRAAKARCTQDPTPADLEELKKRKSLLIAASVTAAVLTAIVIGLIILVSSAIAYM